MDIISPVQLRTVDITFNQLNMLVGPNGTGKTAVMISLYIITKCMYMLSQIGKNIEVFQYIVDNSWDGDTLTGIIGIEYEDGNDIMSMRIEFMCSKIVAVSTNNEENFHKVKPIEFLSKNTRLFSDLDMYLKVKKEVGLDRITNFYKLYDISRFERMIAIMPFNSSHISMDDLPDVSEVFIKDNKTYGKINDEEVPMSSLSAGQQSWINMQML